MCELHDAWPIDRITLYVEGGVEPLQVVGQTDFGGVVDEGDEVESDWMSTDDELEVMKIMYLVMHLKVMS
jgi:hypothetical protein